MSCPVCGDTEKNVINVRISRESNLKQLVGSTWDGRNMARCNGCGVLYDHRFVESGGDGESAEATPRSPEKVNCSACGSLNASDRDVCSYCDEPLNPSTEEDSRPR